MYIIVITMSENTNKIFSSIERKIKTLINKRNKELNECKSEGMKSLLVYYIDTYTNYIKEINKYKTENKPIKDYVKVLEKQNAKTIKAMKQLEESKCHDWKIDVKWNCEYKVLGVLYEVLDM